MTDEGYIKFRADWRETPPLPPADWEDLRHWRQVLYKNGLIGAYPDGVGFGNISCRCGESDQFVITGSATGNYPELGPAHFARVTAVDLAENRLRCEGPVIASSESMSHAVVYRELPWVNGVVHVHHPGLWESLLHRAPTTAAGVPYGTPEMARSIVDLIRRTDLPQRKLFVMEGHREGVFSFGKDLAEAVGVVLGYFERWQLGKEEEGREKSE